MIGTYLSAAREPTGRDREASETILVDLIAKHGCEVPALFLVDYERGEFEHPSGEVYRYLNEALKRCFTPTWVRDAESRLENYTRAVDCVGCGASVQIQEQGGKCAVCGSFLGVDAAQKSSSPGGG